MGSRGPQPSPTATLKLRGSWRGEVRDGEPDAPVAAPACPDWLDGVARDEWRRIVPLLIARGTLSEADLAPLTVYCQSWAVFSESSQKLKADGYTYIVDGEPKLHPLNRVMERAVERILKTADRFGLSPAAKSRLRATTVQPQSKLDAFRLKIAK